MKLYKPKRPSVNPQCSMFFVGDQGLVKYGDERYSVIERVPLEDLEKPKMMNNPFFAKRIKETSKYGF